jgi:hypothetical protein
VSSRQYYTLTFTITFPHADDVAYLAHCFPYAYSDLSALLTELTLRPNAAGTVRMSTLCSCAPDLRAPRAGLHPRRTRGCECEVRLRI